MCSKIESNYREGAGGKLHICGLSFRFEILLRWMDGWIFCVVPAPSHTAVWMGRDCSGGEQRGCVPACLSEKLTISKEK